MNWDDQVGKELRRCRAWGDGTSGQIITYGEATKAAGRSASMGYAFATDGGSQSYVYLPENWEIWRFLSSTTGRLLDALRVFGAPGAWPEAGRLADCE